MPGSTKTAQRGWSLKARLGQGRRFKRDAEGPIWQASYLSSHRLSPPVIGSEGRGEQEGSMIRLGLQEENSAHTMEESLKIWRKQMRNTRPESEQPRVCGLTGVSGWKKNLVYS